VYVGVSSGAFVVAGLANGIFPRMHSMFKLDRSRHDPFEPDFLLRPAFGEFARRLMRLPELIQAAAFAYFGVSPTGRLVESFMRLTRGLPDGLFDNDAIGSYLARLFCRPGRTDDFRKLPHNLFIVATDLRQRQVGAVRRAGVGSCPDLGSGEGERGVASARVRRRPRPAPPSVD
jgi:NTE family protein